jgi:hypothetical protein
MIPVNHNAPIKVSGELFDLIDAFELKYPSFSDLWSCIDDLASKSGGLPKDIRTLMRPKTVLTNIKDEIVGFELESGYNTWCKPTKQSSDLPKDFRSLKLNTMVIPYDYKELESNIRTDVQIETRATENIDKLRYDMEIYMLWMTDMGEYINKEINLSKRNKILKAWVGCIDSSAAKGIKGSLDPKHMSSELKRITSDTFINKIVPKMRYEAYTMLHDFGLGDKDYYKIKRYITNDDFISFIQDRYTFDSKIRESITELVNSYTTGDMDGSKKSIDISNIRFGCFGRSSKTDNLNRSGQNFCIWSDKKKRYQLVVPDKKTVETLVTRITTDLLYNSTKRYQILYNMVPRIVDTNVFIERDGEIMKIIDRG